MNSPPLQSSSAQGAPQRLWLQQGGLALAFAAPWLWPWGWRPFPFFVNEWLALLGWAAAVWLLAQLPAAAVAGQRLAMRSLAAAGLLLIVAAWASALLHQRSGSVAWLTSLALLAAAAVSASGLHSGSWRSRLWPALAAGLLLAALANALTAMLQTWAPAWLPAGIPLPGPGQRIGGLLAQANHLGMLMVWALLALGGWLHLRRWPLAVGLAVLLPLAIGLVLSGSRTAALAWLLAGGALLLAGSPALRRLGVGAWGLAGLAFVAVTLGQPDAGPAALATHLQQGSPSRWPLLLGTLELIARYPLTGTGWGEFNAAWMLSPRDAATPLLVHHSHNLVLQLLAELGLPLGLLLLLLLLAAIGLQGRAAWQARRKDDPLPWLAWAMVLAVLLHSQLELPLWHAHWLLPAAFLLAWASPAAAPGHAPARRLAYAGLLLLLLAVLVLREWLRVLPVHAAPPMQRRSPCALLRPSVPGCSRLGPGRRRPWTPIARSAISPVAPRCRSGRCT